MSGMRPGEMRAAVDPAAGPADAGLRFIGRAQTPWTRRLDTPKNMREARERDHPGPFALLLDPPWRPALQGLEPGQWLHALSWMDRADRDFVVQVPRHRPGPTGTFALRSPARPNPIGLSLVRLVALDADAGRLAIDALDWLDGTPLLDLKPFLGSVDAPPG